MASQQTVSSFLMSQGNNYPQAQIPYIQQQLAALPDEKVMALMGLDVQNPTLLLLVSIFVGSLGVDRFLIGDVMMGVLKLITGGGCGIWWIVDLFLIMDMTKEKNFQKLQQALAY